MVECCLRTLRLDRIVSDARRKSGPHRWSKRRSAGRAGSDVPHLLGAMVGFQGLYKAVLEDARVVRKRQTCSRVEKCVRAFGETQRESACDEFKGWAERGTRNTLAGLVQVRGCPTERLDVKVRLTAAQDITVLKRLRDVIGSRRITLLENQLLVKFHLHVR